GRRPVLVAKETEQWAGQILGKVDWRLGLLRVQLLLAHHHPATPQLAGGVNALAVAGVEKGLPAARAGAEHPDLAVEPGLGAQPLDRTTGVAEDVSVGSAPLGAHLGSDIVGFAFAGSMIKVGADRGIAVMGKFAGRLAVPLVPAGSVMQQHHAGERARTQR